jgi:hypothetical protein
MYMWLAKGRKKKERKGIGGRVKGRERGNLRSKEKRRGGENVRLIKRKRKRKDYLSNSFADGPRDDQG